MKSGRTIRSRFQAAIAEALEPRQLLSGTEYLVNSLDDTVAADGVVTLREAIEAVNTKAPVNEAPAGSATDTDIIRFDPALFANGPGTVLLSGSELKVLGDLQIDGPGAGILSIDAGAKSRVFNVGLCSVSLTGMTITGGIDYNRGGGVYNAGTLTLSAVSISGNRVVNHGGGIYNAPGATMTVQAIGVSGNTATDGYGAGIYNAGALTVADSIFSGNSAVREYGGALLNDFSGTLAIASTTISGNVAGHAGGGMLNWGTTSLANVTMQGNSAPYGGALENSGRASAVNVTITGNYSINYTGGIYTNGSTLVLKNSIVAANVGPTPLLDVYVSAGSLLSAGSDYNLIGALSESQAAAAGAHTLYGSAASPLDAKLGDLAEYGGRFVVPLLAGSPAIDAGSNALAADADGNPLTTDQVGHARIEGATVDIGAIEGVHPARPAVTYVITSLADEIAEDGVLTLREALTAANLNQRVGDAPAGSFSERDHITFAPGLVGTIAVNGSPLVIQSTLSIDGPGAGQLKLQGNGKSRVLRIEGPADAVVAGLTITGGAGGVYNMGTLTLKDAEISDNAVILSSSPDRSGGGIYNAGTLTMANVSLLRNSAYRGGALYNAVGTATITNSTFSGNTGIGQSFEWAHGGAIYNNATLSLADSAISDNTSTVGGGGLYNAEDYGVAILSRVVFSGNSAVGLGAAGGGLLNEWLMTVTDSTFVGNTADQDGGALRNSGRTLTMTRMTMTNVTITGNSVNKALTNRECSGGGVSNGGDLTMTNVTVAGNATLGETVYGGGGIYSWGLLRLRNTIVAGNTAAIGPDIREPRMENSDYNLIGVLLPSMTASIGSHSVYGTAESPLDPKLGSLTQVNGQSVLPLLPGSPALNAGSNALAVDADGNPLTTDAAGQPRIAGGTVDIGAFEYQPQALAISGTEAKDTIELTADETSFSYSINSDPALKMPRSLVTTVRIDAQGGDELSFDLDLQATDLLVQSDPASCDQLLKSISQAIASKSLRTSQADALHGLAAILNSDAEGKRLFNTFAESAVDESSILVKLTWNGDADLNGLLDGSDYFFIDKGYLSRNLPNPLSGYRNGDFNYDGTIDGSDYFLIDKAFLSTRSLAPAAMFQTSQCPPSDRSPLAAHQSPAAAASRPRRATRRTSCVFGRKNDNQIP